MSLPVPAPRSITLPADALRDALRACRPAASSDETRANLCGVRVSAVDGVVYVDATDGHRLHTVTVSLTGPARDACADASITLTLAGADTAIRVLAEVLREAGLSEEAVHALLAMGPSVL